MQRKVDEGKKRTKALSGSAEIAAGIIEDFKAKLPITEIRKKYGMGATTLRTILRKADFEGLIVYEARTPTESLSLECPHCGDPFIPSRQNQTCCDTDCSRDMTRNYRRIHGDLLTCSECGYEMWDDDGDLRSVEQFCSPRCRRDNKERKEAAAAKELRAHISAGHTVLSAAALMHISPLTAKTLLKNHCVHCGSRLIKGDGHKRCVRCTGGEVQPEVGVVAC